MINNLLLISLAAVSIPFPPIGGDISDGNVRLSSPPTPGQCLVVAQALHRAARSQRPPTFMFQRFDAPVEPVEVARAREARWESVNRLSQRELVDVAMNINSVEALAIARACDAMPTPGR